MNWPFAIAGGLAFVGAAIHGIAGDRLLQKMARDALRTNATGSFEYGRTLVRVSWHFVTLTFVLSGFALLYLGLNSTTRLAPGLVGFLGVLYTCFALFAVAIAVGKPQMRFFFTHPAPFALSTIAALIWWGAASM